VSFGISPESCGGVGEALAREPANQPLSREIGIAGVPTLLSSAEGDAEGGAYTRAVQGLHAVEDPEHAEKSFEQEPGDLFFSLQ
jgi:hypothetical protein